ncbi:MAG: glycosyltransferase N-terminal domain-containing protein [Candidatus Marinimicrobia bacterium]|jgi:3-deoxy-D-manno-octulosonic-acid transferase|nr:glycosyltransferase N-terminal domain-containing protein [Candidatus Neomarinimicrobiota bacterium]MDP6610748.1 glycosyltransferase N-terminal domain-containing protein [Candidatus Neomarinimicrobiota bacterium]|tara:strand:+ start:12304 stop:13581 length:1278 start_codon:yes stop_codon:yes gene_type:complete
MIFWKIIYNLILLPLLFAFGIIGSLVNKKIRDGMMGRYRSFRELKSFMDERGAGKTIYWFHAASHGEFEQVKPVLTGLKEVEPQSLSVVSFFSPSGYNHVNDEHIDCKVYLPFDIPWVVKKCLKTIQPKKLILAAYDVWPNLIWGAKFLGIHSTLFAARFSENTIKLSPGIRNFYGNVYSCLSAIYTISNQDHNRLQRILYPVGKPIVRVLGNPRYDQVKRKADKFTRERTESVLLRPKRLLIGSVHSEDEMVILDSIVSLMKEVEDLSLVWVPHEPSERIVSTAESFFQSKHFSTGRLGYKNPGQIDAEVIIVDTIGRLSQLYWFGRIAYIGGGFSSGVHNVMEPAIARLPVFFGPRYNNFHEAEELIADGGGFSIESGTDLYLGIKHLFEDRNAFIKASYAATDVIHRNLGSSTRVVRNLIHD